MRVVFTEAAFSDLDDIAAWIGRDSWDAAEAFVLESRDRCRSLARRRNRHPAAQALPFRNLRKVSHRGYLIFCQAAAAKVEIIHVLQGSRDWEAVLRDEP